jgi:predicted metalloprotease with PDZ domain
MSGTKRTVPVVRLLLVVLMCGASATRPQSQAGALEPIQYTFRVIDPGQHLAGVDARVPTAGRPTIELMMPVWTPGYYVVEDYAGRVRDLTVKAPDGSVLKVTKPKNNRWSVETKGAPYVSLSYTLVAQGRSVTSNWVDAELGVINGGAAFISLAEQARRPHDVRLEMPPTWQQSASGLDPAPGGQPNHYRAPDFDTLADSPIVAGTLAIREFVVGGATHVIADAGQHAQWNGDRSAEQIEKMVREVWTFWGALPFERYVFLNVFRQGGGGLEHANSTLLTSSPKATEPTNRWLSFVAHEYFHAFNVKRLRPVELGPFDYENPPRTTSLWFSEGGTTYYGSLMLARAGVLTKEDFLASMSSAIDSLQKAPGRLLQSLEQSSADVWTNSNSGVGADATTVSYYVKGNVVSFLLDAHIRRVTYGRRSMDDVMRLAMARYGGERGFTAAELRATVEQIAGRSMKAWFKRAIETPGELDYDDMLGWYGLRFAAGDGASWKLEARPGASRAQQDRLRALLTSSGPGDRPRSEAIGEDFDNTAAPNRAHCFAWYWLPLRATN